MTDDDPTRRSREGEPPQRRRDAADAPRSDAGDRAARAAGAGDKKPYVKRDGDKKPYVKRDGDKKPYPARDGERKSYPPRDGERKSYPPRDGERKPFVKRDGDRPSYPKRDGDKKPYAARDGERKSFTPRDGSSRPPRAGAGRDERREDRQSRPEELRAVRSTFEEPIVPDEVVANDLNAAARNQLKTLSKENAEAVARHLAMAAEVIDADPQLAHQHAIAATRRAGRIGVVRETAAITAYAIGDYALALRELRTYRRISGSDDQIALMVDSERGVGRPDRALEVGRAVDRNSLAQSVRVELAIAMSGARLDLGETERALQELDIPELDPDRAFEWSPALFAARATVLEELGRDDEAIEWHRRADVAEAALNAANGSDDLEVLIVEEIIEDHSYAEDESVEDESAEDESVVVTAHEEAVDSESQG